MLRPEEGETPGMHRPGTQRGARPATAKESPLDFDPR